MKKILLTTSLILSLFCASAQECCLKAYTSLTNTPFKCLSDPNTKIADRPISEFVKGGSSRVNIATSNGQLQTVNFSETPKSYGSETYGFNGKMVQVLTRNVVSITNSGFISPQTYIVDDACNVVCSWAVSQPVCVTFPCPPVNHNSCNNHSFFSSSQKLDYTPLSFNFECMANLEDSITIQGISGQGSSLKISKSDLRAGGNTNYPTSGGVIVYPEPNHYPMLGAINPQKQYGGQTYIYNGRKVKVYTYTKLPMTGPNSSLRSLAVVIDESCSYVGHWQWNQVYCVTTPCYPVFEYPSSISSFFSTAILEGGQ